MLEHLTSSANHSDCSINKNDHKSGYTFPFSRLHLPKYKTYNFFPKFILKNGGGRGHLIIGHKSHSVEVFAWKLKIVMGGGRWGVPYMTVNTSLPVFIQAFFCLSLF